MLDATIATMPVADPGQPLIVDEGTSVSATATSTGPAPYVFDWSLTQGMTTIETSTDPTFNFTAIEDGTYELSVEVKASSGELMTDTLAVLVNNVAPELVDPADVTISENGTATLVTTIQDPGTMDVFSVDVDWMDGTSDTITGLGSANVMATIGGTTYEWNANTRQLTLSHEYLDDGNSPGNNIAQDLYDVSLLVHDDDGGTGAEQTATVTVNNVVPVLVDPADVAISENGTATLVTTINDPGTLDVFSVDVNWMDGTSDTITGLGLVDASGTAGGTTFEWIAATRQLTLSHQYLDDGISPGDGVTPNHYAVTLVAHDDDTGVSTHVTATITVNNLSPELTDPADVTISENGTATLVTTINDPGTLDVFSVDVDWMDGTSDTITGLGLVDIASTTVGGTTYEWVAATRQLTLSHQYLDDGISPGDGVALNSYDVSLVARDDDLGVSAAVVAQVTVNNVAPQLVDPADVTILENGTATLVTTINDPGTLDVFSVDVDWMDGTSDTITGLGLVDLSGTVGGTTYEWVASTRQLTLRHKYLDDGVSPGNNTAQDFYDATLLVHDDDAETGAQQIARVTVNNVAPVLVDPADVTISENGTATLVTTINDPGTLDVFSVDVDWMDGASDTIAGLGLVDIASTTVGGTTYEWVAAIRQLTLSHKYLDDGVSPGDGVTPNSYDVTLVARDDDMGVSTPVTATVSVNNAAPVLADPADVTISENGTATLVTTINDPGTLDVFSVDVNWMDGTSDTITELGLVDIASATVGGTTYEWVAATRQLTLSHQYLDDGISPGDGVTPNHYDVTLVARDDDTGVSTPVMATVTVNNVAPVLVDPADVTISENGTATLVTTINDPGTQDVFSVDVDWMDGTSDTITGLGLVDVASTTVGGTTYEWVAATRQLTLSHQYLDDGVSPGDGVASNNYDVTLLAKDDDTGVGTPVAAIVTVNNVAPQLVDPADVTILENGTATLVTTLNDPGTLDVFSVDVNWMDGTSDTITGLGLSDIASTTVGRTTFEWIAATRQLTLSHQYLDDGVSPGDGVPSNNYDVTLVAKDDDLGVGTPVTATITVNNVAPELLLNSVAAINENGIATLSGSYTDIGLLDGHTATIDWGDPNDTANSTFNIPAIRDAAGMATLSMGDTFMSSTDEAVLTITSVNAATGEVGFSVQHQYLDDGAAPGDNTAANTSTINVTVADDDAGSDTDSEMVTVNNVAPALALNTVTSINENGSATLTGSYTDIGLLDGHTLTIDWGDPNDPANSTFNIPAIRDAAGTATLSMGDTFMSSTDEAVLTIMSVNAATGEVGFSVQHQYLDDGAAPGDSTADNTSTIQVTVADDDTGSDDESASVLVKNVAPVLTVVANQTRDEGQLLDLSGTGGALTLGSFTDVGTLDLHRVQIDWGDGLIEPGNISQLAGSGTITGTHTYADNGTYTVTVRIADDDMTGNFASGVAGVDFVETTFLVTVANVDPTLTAVDLSTTTLNEGDSISFDAFFNDPGFDNPNNDNTPPNGGEVAESFTYDVDWGDGRNEVVNQSVADTNGGPGVLSTGTFAANHIYADNGVYTLTVTVHDDDGGSHSLQFLITVGNVDPILTGTSNHVVDEGEAFTLASLGVGLSDPGFDNPNNDNMPPNGGEVAETFNGLTIDWGDGTADTPVTIVNRVSGGPGVLTTAGFDHASHTYADNGVYTISVTMQDDDGPVVTREFTITVNNVAPTLANLAPSAATINENGSVSFSVTFTDPGFDNPANDNTPPNGGEVAETFTYDINWGDGRQEQLAVTVDASNGAVGVPSAGSFGGSHIYADDGTYTVTLMIHDDDGGVHSQVFTVVVQNTAPQFVPNAEGDSFEGTDIDSGGFTTITVSYLDAGFDNTANQNPSVLPNISDPRHETFTHLLNWGDGTIDAVHTYADPGVYNVSVSVVGPDLNGSFEFAGFDGNGLSVLTLVSGQLLNAPGAVPYTYQISWGDGVVQTVTLMLNQPGVPLANNGLTTVFTSLRTSGGEGVNTTGSFEAQHRYLGPPNPANPTAPIQITVAVVDDNNASVSDFIFVPNPGISVNNVAIDTTPEIARLEFVPPDPTNVFLGQLASSVQSLQTQDFRAARSEQNLTTDLYLELVVVYPDGSKSPGIRLKQEDLQDLRALFATLPDNLYQIYLVRTENNSRRLVMEVYVRQGRVVDPSDDSEGTRDLPPIVEQAPAPNAVPLDENPLLEQAPDQSRTDPSQPAEQHSAAETGSENASAERDGAVGVLPAFPHVRTLGARFGSSLQWSVPLVGLGAAVGGWPGRIEAVLEQADDRAWQRLRRAGWLGRATRPSKLPEVRQKVACGD